MSVNQALEHSGHIAHAAHNHNGAEDRLGTYIGVTMAILGVLLALCSALVGSERTDLVHKLVEQQHAHAKYQAQDIKHRVAFLALSQMHATAFGSADAAAKMNKADVAYMATAVKRYFEEAALAKKFTESFNPIITVHLEAQKHYEHALLLAEIGIVIASISLLVHSRVPWLISLLFGIGALIMVSSTWLHVAQEVKASKDVVIVTQKAYEDARKANKSTQYEESLTDSFTEWLKKKP